MYLQQENGQEVVAVSPRVVARSALPSVFQLGRAALENMEGSEKEGENWRFLVGTGKRKREIVLKLSRLQ